VLAEGFVVKSGGHFGVGLGEGERDAISHTTILAFSSPRRQTNSRGKFPTFAQGKRPKVDFNLVQAAGIADLWVN
jgi:hypothetical protein